MRRFYTRRDPAAQAWAAEAHAERVETDAAWLVAADAWEEAGDPRRARFAVLRQRQNAITHAEASRIRRLLDRYRHEQAARGITDTPVNAEISQLEIYDFLLDPPKQLFAYFREPYFHEPGDIITFVGDRLGGVVKFGGQTRAFGRGPRLQHVTVRAINVFMYSGTCNLETGTYCKLRRGKAWLRR